MVDGSFNHVPLSGRPRDCATLPHRRHASRCSRIRRRVVSRRRRRATGTTPQQPTAAACLGCHDSQSAAAHAFVNTAPFGEACAACHGPGRGVLRRQDARAVGRSLATAASLERSEGVKSARDARRGGVVAGRPRSFSAARRRRRRRRRRQRLSRAGQLPTAEDARRGSAAPPAPDTEAPRREAAEAPPSAPTATRTRSRASPRNPHARSHGKGRRIPRSSARPATGTATKHIEAGGDTSLIQTFHGARGRRELPLLPREDEHARARSRSGSTRTPRRSTVSELPLGPLEGTASEHLLAKDDGGALPDLPHRDLRLVPQQAVRAPSRSRRHDLRRLPRPARPQGPAASS